MLKSDGTGRVSAWLIILLAFLAGVSSCQLTADGPAEDLAGRTLTVYAAASLKGAFDELARGYETTHPEFSVLINFAGSQQLAQQIAQGAPVDVFASADNRQMAIAIESGRIAPGAPQLFIHNRLVVIVPPENPGDLSQLSDLARPGLRLVLADEKVPVGGYAAQFLAAASHDPAFGPGFEEQVRKNVVSFEENVRAVASKVGLGEADAGVVYLSDYVSAPSQTLDAIPIPDHLNPVAAYPIAPVADTVHLEFAQDFIEFVRGPEGQAILANYGYMPLSEGQGREPGFHQE